MYVSSRSAWKTGEKPLACTVEKLRIGSIDGPLHAVMDVVPDSLDAVPDAAPAQELVGAVGADVVVADDDG